MHNFLKLASLGVTLSGSLGAATIYNWQASSGLLPNQVAADGGTVSLIDNGVGTVSLGGGELTFAGTYSSSVYYDLNFGALAPDNDVFENGITITTSFIVDSSSQFDNRRGAVSMGFRTGESRQSSATGIDFFRLIRDFETGSPIATVDTNGSFHTYRIEVDGTGVGSGIRVFQDGNQILSRTTGGLDSGESTDIQFFFGDASGIAGGTSRFQSFRIDTVPEPSAALLGGLAGLVLLRRKR